MEDSGITNLRRFFEASMDERERCASIVGPSTAERFSSLREALALRRRQGPSVRPIILHTGRAVADCGAQWLLEPIFDLRRRAKEQLDLIDLADGATLGRLRSSSAQLAEQTELTLGTLHFLDRFLDQPGIGDRRVLRVIQDIHVRAVSWTSFLGIMLSDSSQVLEDLESELLDSPSSSELEPQWLIDASDATPYPSDSDVGAVTFNVRANGDASFGGELHRALNSPDAANAVVSQLAELVSIAPISPIYGANVAWHALRVSISPFPLRAYRAAFGVHRLLLRALSVDSAGTLEVLRRFRDDSPPGIIDTGRRIRSVLGSSDPLRFLAAYRLQAEGALRPFAVTVLRLLALSRHADPPSVTTLNDLADIESALESSDDGICRLLAQSIRRDPRNADAHGGAVALPNDQIRIVTRSGTQIISSIDIQQWYWEARCLLDGIDTAIDLATIQLIGDDAIEPSALSGLTLGVIEGAIVTVLSDLGGGELVSLGYRESICFVRVAGDFVDEDLRAVAEVVSHLHDPQSIEVVLETDDTTIRYSPKSG